MLNCCNCSRMKRIGAFYARSSGHVTAQKSKSRSTRRSQGMTKIASMTPPIPRVLLESAAPASRAAGRVPDAGELENRPRAQSGIAAEPSCGRRQGDRIGMTFAAVHESGSGTFETCRLRRAMSECVSAWNKGSDSHPMKFSAELAVLQRGNQRHASRYSNFVAYTEWVGYRERK
jgi:hypothetical protein